MGRGAALASDSSLEGLVDASKSQKHFVLPPGIFPPPLKVIQQLCGRIFAHSVGRLDAEH